MADNIVKRGRGPLFEGPMGFVRRGMDDLFSDFFREFGIEPFSKSVTEGAFIPRIDLSEDDKSITLNAELPGMDDKDIQINIADDLLTIEGEKKFEHEEKKKNYHHIERSFGKFKRVIPLSSEVDQEKIAANFKKGLLTVTMPKLESAKPKTKKIEVKSE